MSGGRGVGVATTRRGVGDGEGAWMDGEVAVERRVGDGLGVRLGVDVGEGLPVDVGVAVGCLLGDGRGVGVSPDAAIATGSSRARVVASTSQAGDS